MSTPSSPWLQVHHHSIPRDPTALLRSVLPSPPATSTATGPSAQTTNNSTSNLAPVTWRGILLLDSPSVSNYELDFFLDAWEAGKKQQQAEGQKQQQPTQQQCRPLFACADGAGAKLYRRAAERNGNTKQQEQELKELKRVEQYPCDFICGDMDSLSGLGGAESGAPGSAFGSDGVSRAGMTLVRTPHVSRIALPILQKIAARAGQQPQHQKQHDPPVLVSVAEDQDSTDFMKCLFLMQRAVAAGYSVAPTTSTPTTTASGVDHVLVLGAMGGRFDHTVASLCVVAETALDASLYYARYDNYASASSSSDTSRLFRFQAAPPPPPLRVVLHDADNTIVACTPRGRTAFSFDSGVDRAHCGVMAFGGAPTDAATSTGLKYNLPGTGQGIWLGMGAPGLMQSTSNQVTKPNGTIIIDTTAVRGTGPPPNFPPISTLLPPAPSATYSTDYKANNDLAFDPVLFLSISRRPDVARKGKRRSRRHPPLTTSATATKHSSHL